MSKYYQVAVNFPQFHSVLTYKSDQDFFIGDLVDVPLGKRNSQGIIMGITSPEQLDGVEDIKIKAVSGSVENAVRLTEIELELYKWTSRYYHYPLGKLIFDALPKILKRPRKVEFISGSGEHWESDLSPEQENAFHSIANTIESGFSQHYVHGITGSGKSIVFLKLIQKAIDSGKSVQFLLPEINLTPQFVGLFSEFLNCKILTYHSGVTPSEKYNIWKALHETHEPVLVMGVRSSVFLPIEKLGLVIIDEEHDSSFKQTDRCPYNGRDVAIKKAQLSNCPVVMGSATPAMENFFHFSNQQSNRHYYTMKERVGEATLPELLIKDTRDKFLDDDPTWPLLPETIQALRERVEAGEQALVFINKLGYSHFVQCRSCGHRFINEKCGCENNLRYFKNKNMLSCAHCEYKAPLPDSCPECGNMKLLQKGFGTEKILEVLEKNMPGVRIKRFDRDEITTLSKMNETLDSFHNKEIDIMVGTQMLAKGHNFKNVNLVVILGVDNQLSSPDFRASERMYQLVNQVSGRAGRYGDQGQVVIQTMNPDHTIFQHLVRHDFDEFYQAELSLREFCHCPPFGKMAMLFISCRFRDRLVSTAQDIAAAMKRTLNQHYPDVKLLGPAPMSIEKKANQFTWGIMLKSENVSQLHGLLSAFEEHHKPISGVSIKIDVDPYHVL
jgi:primosomal protein N' (replication factor Y)